MTEDESIAADVVKIRSRIAEIDAMFEKATGWGSWMSEASSERRGLVRQAAIRGVKIEDANVLQTSSGTVSD